MAMTNHERVGKALELVKKDHILHQQTMLDAIENPEDLIALVGEARALKISKALVARLQAKNKAKVEGKPKADEVVREKTTEIIDRKLGRNKYGYSEMDLTRKH